MALPLQLRDLRGLLGHVRDSDALIILQSAEILQRPWYEEHGIAALYLSRLTGACSYRCLLEMNAAIEAGVPIVAVAVSGKVQVQRCCVQFCCCCINGPEKNYIEADSGSG